MNAQVNPASSLLERLRPHWPLAVILSIAAGLLLTNLGRDYLWADEGDTAVLARSILQFGVPTAWDGVTFTDSDFGARLTDGFVMMSGPWLQYYVTAASFLIFGESAFAARLPFALAGLLTIALVYQLVYRATTHRWTAATAAALLTLSVQFLVFSRLSRHYALHAALMCLLVGQFTRLTSWSGALRFALVGVLLFHTHPIGLSAIAALGAACIWHRPFRVHWPWYWRGAAIVLALSVPWLALAPDGYKENTGLLNDVSVFLPRLGQFLIEMGSVTGLVGVLALLVFLRLRRPVQIVAGRKGSRQRVRLPIFDAGERGLLLAIAAIFAVYGITMALTQPRDVLWTVGMRYTPAVLAFSTIAAAIVIARASRFRWRPWVALFLVFGFTKFARLTPWTIWEEPSAHRDRSTAVTFHVPERLIDRVFRTAQPAFLDSLGRTNAGTTGRIVEYLQRHAAADDIVVTNYAWEPLYFHTGLRQGMTVLPSYPIYSAARDRKLPEYVFRPDGARWIVWRRAWGAYRGQQLDRVLEYFASQNVPVTLVAAVPETLWENRENVHFRRYAGNKYIYPWFGGLPDTLI